MSGHKVFKTWLTEIHQSDWLVTMVQNSIDRDVENNVLKTIDNDFSHSLFSFRHLKLFDTLKKILETLSFFLVSELSFPVLNHFCVAKT